MEEEFILLDPVTGSPALIAPDLLSILAGEPGLAALTDRTRYRDLAGRFPRIAPESGTCGCHVHVGVPSRDLGVQVLARLRPWLAPLLALSANSPIANGQDTGWASWRYRLVSRWPTVRGCWLAEGDSVRRPVQEGLCRTQLTVRLRDTAIEELLTAPLGNHLVVVRGHHRDRLAGWLRTTMPSDLATPTSRARGRSSRWPCRMALIGPGPL